MEAHVVSGQVGYDAYAKSTGGKTFDGRPMPKWEDLPPNIRRAWTEAAHDILFVGLCNLAKMLHAHAPHNPDDRKPDVVKAETEQ